MAESLRDKLRRLRREDGPSRTVDGEAAAPASAERTPSAAPSSGAEAAFGAGAERREHESTSTSVPSSSTEREAGALTPSATARALVHGLARRGERLAQHLERRAEARSARATSASTLHGERDVVAAAPLAHTDVATTTGAPSGLERCARSNVSARRMELAREHAHGAWKLEEALTADAATLALLAKDDALAEHALRDALFLDTETTGLSGGAGTYVFLVGLGSFTTDGFEVWQGFLGDPSEEKALLTETAER
ncbi:MAG: ribonuclease H-like domain-containing protein, partial [Planctomycetes bacterium]|nr:ribonuclease H-like domain-containing protein [Planctomycetota bacterium]